MKSLVIYYSLEGNTKFIAESIASAVSADILELKPRKELNPKSPMRFLLGGAQVMKRTKPELLPYDKTPQNYDILFIGTPVWAWNYSPTLNTFFSNIKLKGKKIAIFCCHGGQKGKTLNNMKSALKDNEFIGEIDFIEPLKNKENDGEKAKQWVKEIIGGSNVK